jgi:AraC-like DNA-binding protein
VRALVIAPRDAAGVRAEALVAATRAGHPRATVLAYCPLVRGDPSASAAVAALVRAGAHAVVLRDVDDEPHALRAALRGAEQSGGAAQVLAQVAKVLPPTVQAVVGIYLRADDAAPPSVAEVALALGVHRRTLVNRMRAAGCPPPRALRAWCRVFVAAYLLEERGRTVESVALQLDFDSPSGLRNTLRRYTGHAPHALRTAGGLQCALGAFAAACDRRRGRAQRRGDGRGGDGRVSRR